MPAYIILNFDVTDWEAYRSYETQVGPLLIREGAEVLVVSDNSKVLEGSKSSMNVVIRFDTEEKASKFYNSAGDQPPSSGPCKFLVNGMGG